MQNEENNPISGLKNAAILGIIGSLLFLIVSWIISYISGGMLTPSLDITLLIDSVMANELIVAVETGAGIVLFGIIIMLISPVREYLGI